jgi:hypothetical protein
MMVYKTQDCWISELQEHNIMETGSGLDPAEQVSSTLHLRMETSSLENNVSFIFLRIDRQSPNTQ